MSMTLVENPGRSAIPSRSGSSIAPCQLRKSRLYVTELGTALRYPSGSTRNTEVLPGRSLREPARSGLKVPVGAGGLDEGRPTTGRIVLGCVTVGTAVVSGFGLCTGESPWAAVF